MIAKKKKKKKKKEKKKKKKSTHWYEDNHLGLTYALSLDTVPVFPPQIQPSTVAVAHTIFPRETGLQVGLVECCMWQGTGQRTHTNFRVSICYYLALWEDGGRQILLRWGLTRPIIHIHCSC